MSEPIRDHVGPWTEAEYLALGETLDKIELIDGSLLVSPAPNRPHQYISLQTGYAILEAAEAAGLLSWEAINLRLGPRRMVIPDLAVGSMDFVGTVADAADVVLVGEILSPPNAANDQVLKRKLYAEARIPWYLLIEPDLTDYQSITLRLNQLAGGAYLEYAVARTGQVLKSDLPFPFLIDTNKLLRLRPPTVTRE